MLLTWPTIALGIIGAGLQVVAHIIMWEGGKPEREPTKRYAVGTFLIGICLSAGIALDPRQDPIAAFWYIAILAGGAVGACYEVRRRWPKPHRPISRSDLDFLAEAITGEHDHAAHARPED